MLNAPFYYRISFWNKMKDSIAIIGPSSEIFVIVEQLDSTWSLRVAIATLLGYLISHLMKTWITDLDGDGKIDPI